MARRPKLISIIIPVYNEEENVFLIYQELCDFWKVFKNKYQFEILFVNDGSSDQSQRIIEQLSKMDNRVKYLEFTRNFGKEVATSAGLKEVHGEAAIIIDADLQHPPKLIQKFVKRWEQGIPIVIGVRRKSKGEGIIKRMGSWFFYKLINKLSDTKVTPSSTDFRLIDRRVIDEFNRFTERSRITRGLIDWLGFDKIYVYFDARARAFGQASYSFSKLMRLAFSTFTTHSLFPLKIAGYLGVIITLFSGSLGFFMLIEFVILGDPLGLNFSGPAMLAVFNSFLIGVVLMCLGLIALYIGNIHAEVINRPMYVLKDAKLRGHRGGRRLRVKEVG